MPPATEMLGSSAQRSSRRSGSPFYLGPDEPEPLQQDGHRRMKTFAADGQNDREIDRRDGKMYLATVA
jgi:hypothetical protein